MGEGALMSSLADSPGALRLRIASLLAGIFALSSITQAAALQFSPSNHRRWNADGPPPWRSTRHAARSTPRDTLRSVSRASRKPAPSSIFEQFIWLAPAVKVSVDFWVD